MYKDFWKKSCEDLVAMDFDSYGIGGLSVGESKDIMYDILEGTTPYLPQDKARYFMGEKSRAYSALICLTASFLLVWLVMEWL